VDRVITQRQADLLLPILALFVLTPLIATLMGFANNVTVSLIGDKLVLDLRKQLYNHLLRLPMRFFDKSSTGGVMERLMGDVSQVQSMVASQTITLVTDVVACVFAMAVLFSLNWRLTLLIMVIVPVYVVNHHFFIERIRYWRERLREKMEQISADIQERLAGAAAVKAYGQERAETRQFVTDAYEARNLGTMASGYEVAFATAASIIYWTGHTGAYLMGCYLVIMSEMSLGSVIAFTSYCVYLLTPAVRFSNMANMVERSMVSVRRIDELLDEPADPPDPPDVIRRQRFIGQVEFDHVWFEYEPDNPVLRDVSLSVPAGTTVALVGHTGCGKTTIISLLMRFYRVTSGTLRIDGTDINRLAKSALRANMAMVPQDPVLFEGTIRENIAYGRPRASIDEVIRAAKAAEIHKTIEALPDGYDTPFGQEGVKLSLGEKQRLTIARAILADPAILILDEATSSLDTESERLLQRALEKIMQNRTSFVIAHRLSTIINADLIVVLAEGRILETGSHHELLNRKGGHYRQLYFTQFSKVA